MAHKLTEIADTLTGAAAALYEARTLLSVIPKDGSELRQLLIMLAEAELAKQDVVAAFPDDKGKEFENKSAEYQQAWSDAVAKYYTALDRVVRAGMVLRESEGQ